MSRTLQRALQDPGNSWAWYELAKEGYNWGQLMNMAKDNGVTDTTAVAAGYLEFMRC